MLGMFSICNAFIYTRLNQQDLTDGQTMKLPIKSFRKGLGFITPLTLLAMVFALPTQAHHNYFTDFNPRVEILIEGVVSEVKWQNPHIEVYLDVTDENGQVSTWTMPNAAPFVAAQNGWDEETIVVGTHMTFKGWPSRDGSNSMRAIEMFFADGRTYEMQMWCKLNCAGHDLDGN